jgi:hypothetical protein
MIMSKLEIVLAGLLVISLILFYVGEKLDSNRGE